MSSAPHSARRYHDDDRRDDPRFHVRIPVVIQTDGVKRMRRTVDLSCGGARITSDPQGAPPDGPVRLIFRPPGREPVDVVALPVWTTSDSIGVKFIIADEMERLAVAELIDAGMSQAHAAA